MQRKRYSRPRLTYANVTATLALFFALTGVGLVQAGVIVTSKQIKNGTILSQDIKNNQVKTADVKNGTLDSADIGNGEVEPQDVTMPEPEQIKEPGGEVGHPTMAAFAKVDDMGTYTKEDPESVLEVDWTGSVLGENGGETSGCVFQLRVDGAAAPGGGGEVFGAGLVSVSATALFLGLPAGTHSIEVWARLAAFELSNPDSNACVVGPQAAGIGQTVVVSEQIF